VITCLFLLQILSRLREDEQFVGELEKELCGELKNLLKAPSN